MADAPSLRGQVLQRGKEVTAGTLVAATHRVPFEPGSLKWDPVYDRIRRRNSGSGATSHSSSTTLVHSGASWDERATYNFLAVLLETFLGAATITDPHTSTDKNWAFLPSDTAPDGVVRHSLEMGGLIGTWPEEEQMAGMVGKSLKIAWNKTDDVMLSVEMQGVRSTQGAKTGSLAIPAGLVPILGKLVRVYQDTSTFGSTSVGRAISGEITIENEVSERFGSDGNDYPNRIVVLGRNVTASMIVEYDATTDRVALRAGTLEKVRVAFPGPVLGGGNYDFRLDIPQTFDTSEIGDDDGVVTLAMDSTAEYNSSLGADIAATVVCAIAAVP